MALLMALKVTHTIDIPWWVVVSPLSIAYSAIVVVVLVMALLKFVEVMSHRLIISSVSKQLAKTNITATELDEIIKSIEREDRE